jgi:hypothetical protein
MPSLRDFLRLRQFEMHPFGLVILLVHLFTCPLIITVQDKKVSKTPRMSRQKGRKREEKGVQRAVKQGKNGWE